MTVLRRWLLALAATVTLAGPTVPAAAAEESLTIGAAISLGPAFTEIARAFEAANPGATVRLTTGASGVLLAQLKAGAPMDVLASADTQTLDDAASQSLLRADSRVDIARNTLVLVVPQGSTLALARLADLSQPAVRRIAAGNPATVPAGRYAQAALQAAGLDAALKDRLVPTQNVRQALDYVARGEVDAGFVYATDAAQLPDKVLVRLTVPTPTPIVYPMAVTAASPQPALAQRFVAFVRSEAAQAVLRRHGFASP